MTFLSGTPLDCTIHPNLWFNNYTSDLFDQKDLPKFARYLRHYSKKYCTEMHVSPFLLYFPFTLFLVPLLIVFIEKAFTNAYKYDDKLEQFYTFLLKGSLEREDVADMEAENVQNSHELQQAFRNSNNCYNSYLIRTILELIASTALAAFYCSFRSIDGFLGDNMFDCDIHGVDFKCIIPNSRFFWVVYFLACANIFTYICLTSYNLVWLVHPKVSKLQRILFSMYRRNTDSVDGLECVIRDESIPEVRLDMYFNEKGRDFRLLMNLLGETAGLAQSFRLLSLFDKHFQRQWRPKDVKVIVEDSGFKNPFEDDEKDDTFTQLKWDENEKKHKCLFVQWNDASIADFMNRAARNSLFEYTVEISPSSHVEAPVKSFLYHNVPDFSDLDSVTVGGGKGFFQRQISVAAPKYPGTGKAPTYKYSARFDGLVEGKTYSLSISTELDGKTITQVKMVAMRGDEGDEDESQQRKGCKDKDKDNANDGERNKKKKKKKPTEF